MQITCFATNIVAIRFFDKRFNAFESPANIRPKLIENMARMQRLYRLLSAGLQYLYF